MSVEWRRDEWMLRHALRSEESVLFLLNLSLKAAPRLVTSHVVALVDARIQLIARFGLDS
jgi:hypothetical protein